MPLKNRKIKVLFVSRWYPNRLDAMEGLFVKKHALAATLYNEVQVLFVKEDPSVKRAEIEMLNNDALQETIVYYPFSKFRILRALRYFNALFQGYRQIKRNGFIPQLLHVNVLTRVGFFAYLVKLFNRTPYVISEHWSRYFEHGHFSTTSFLHKYLTKFIVRKSAFFMPVSNLLKRALDKFELKNKNCQIVHNTIEDFFWQQTYRENRSVKRFLHVSCFDEKAKNVKGIIRAFVKLYQQRQDIELVIAGVGVDFVAIKTFAESQNVPIFFLGELTPIDVAKWMCKSDAFVLFSNYETSGVVLMESLASGIPVISTPCGIASEIITDKSGIIVPFADEDSLTEKMNWILENQFRFNRYEISQSAEQFRFSCVGKQLSKIYHHVIEDLNRGSF